MDEKRKSLPIDPLGLRSIELEVSEKVPEGELACGSQAFIAICLLILRRRRCLSSRRRSPKVSDCSPANRERELGLDRRETG